MSAPLFTSFFADYDRSIKNRIVEEGYDLYFSRPLGFIFAKWLSALKLSPTNISVVGMLIGVSGGVMLSQQNVLFYTALGGLLVTFAGILDSSDGQAARLYNTHTEMGRYLDMFNDMLVFIACYAGGLYYFVDTYTWYGFWGLGLLSGYMHSLKSNIYEYYKGEFLHFSLTDSKNRNYSLEYIHENFDRTGLIRSITYPILIDYVRRQNQNKFRVDATTALFEKARAYKPEEFKDIYIQESRKLLALWAWVCGSNVMRNGLIISSLFGRMDIYVIANIFSYFLFLGVGKLQQRVDRRIEERIKDWDLADVVGFKQP